MNNNQTLKAGMLKRMGLFFTKHQSTLQPFTKLWDIITCIEAKEVQLNLLIQQQAIDSTGETKNKLRLKEAMINSLTPCARKARVWANEQNNMVLETLFDINQKTFLAGDDECLGIVRNVLQGLNDNSAALVAYNVTTAQLTDIETASKSFETSIGKSGQARNTAKTGTQGIEDTLKEMMDLLYKCDDLIEAEFSGKQPDMVSEYFSNRRIGASVKRHTTLNVVVYASADKTIPLPDALVTLVEYKLSAVTDAEGHASIDTFTAGNLTALVTANGFADVSVPFTVKTGREASLEIVLNKKL